MQKLFFGFSLTLKEKTFGWCDKRFITEPSWLQDRFILQLMCSYLRFQICMMKVCFPFFWTHWWYFQQTVVPPRHHRHPCPSKKTSRKDELLPACGFKVLSNVTWKRIYALFMTSKVPGEKFWRTFTFQQLKWSWQGSAGDAAYATYIFFIFNSHGTKDEGRLHKYF